MFDLGSTVYFRSPVSFGRVVETPIGYRWWLQRSDEVDLNHTAPLFAAAAGILKSRFIVKDVIGEFLLVSSVDNEANALVIQDFLTDKAASSILTGEEKRLLFYYQWLSESTSFVGSGDFEDKEDEKAEEDTSQPAEAPESVKSSADPASAFGENRVKNHNCQSCGKCSNKSSNKETKVNNGPRTLKEKADMWDKLFGEQESACDDLSDEELDYMIKDLVNALMERLEETKAKPEIHRFMPKTRKRYQVIPSVCSMSATVVPEDILRRFF